MPPPAKWRSQRGLLLVEAILSAIIVAVGLVFVSRALSSELKAIQTVQESAAVAPLAYDALRQMDGLVQIGQAPGTQREGAFDPPNAGYRWSLSAQPLDTGEPEPRYGLVTLVIHRVRDNVAVLSAKTLWPLERVPNEWLQ